MNALAHAEEPSVGAPAWVLPYSDMMTLLLACFIMVTSMSEIKEDKKFHAMSESLRQRFGENASAAGLTFGSSPMDSSAAKFAAAGRSRRAKTIDNCDLVRPGANVVRGDRGRSDSRHDRAQGTVWFDGYGASLTPESQQRLTAIARTIGQPPQEIEIRGHAATIAAPADSPDQTPWDLACARCSAVMQQLAKLGINPGRMRITVASGDNADGAGELPSGLEENWPVEILMFNEFSDSP